MTRIDDTSIAASNVRPAFEASLRHGTTEAELEAATGLTWASFEAQNAAVSADAPARHMELMHGKPSFGPFLVDAVETYSMSSLGVVGLACKTMSTLGEAMRCHHRYQHLTNRTARYASREIDGRFILEEHRSGSDRLGTWLIADYAMFVTIRLLRMNAVGEVRVLEMGSRRPRLEPAERALYERLAGAPVRAGVARASVSLARGVTALPVTSADPELSRYFQGLLARAARFDEDEDPLLVRVRLSIRDRLLHGTPTAAEVARTLGVGPRTLQRRLAALGPTFAELLESTRKGLAEGYLSDPALSLAEIAYLLGYREQTSFFRAFKRWHGVTPGRYRHERGETSPEGSV